MNQILNTSNRNQKIIQFFKLQFCISLVFIIIGMTYLIKNIQEKERENKISNIISLNAKLNSIFSHDEEKIEFLYFGQILCEKIHLDNYIYNEYSEDNLKILPCKFSGGNLGENTNICIIGHNYFDNRFFSNLNQLEKGDKVVIKDLEENRYEFMVYDIYEIEEEKIEEVIQPKKEKELTLCTCTLEKNKRLIVRAEIMDEIL